MKTIKKFSLAVISLIWVFVLSSCSTTSSLPYDDVYYTPGDISNNQTATALSEEVYTSSSSTGDYQSYYKGETSEVEQVPVGDVSEGEYYSEDTDSNEDIYYDTDYESRIKRFNNEGSSLGYYDDYYTNDYGCNCGGSSNYTVSLGFGVGWGYPYYSYGYPYYGYGYPYYGWGYPYYGYGYPYYGWGGSYWNGYNNGYWNGYWDGYYGGGYGGGYYDGYYGYSSSYGPRGSRTGGTSVPRTGSRGSTDRENPSYREKTIVAGGGSIGSSRTGGGTVSSGSQAQKSRPAESVRVKQENQKNKSTVQGKEFSKTQTERYRKPTGSSKTEVRQKPKYDKPQSYRTLPSQKPRSENKYVAPKRNSQTSNSSKSNVRTNTRKPVNQPTRNYNRSTKTRSSGTKSVTTPTRTRTATPKRSTSSSSPSKSYSRPSRSYSSPSRSSSSPSRSYSSPSRSSSSPSRSSGSSSSSSRSSSGGGRR